MVVNRTSAILRVWTRGIDCYDWGGTSNPSRLDGIELSPGVSSANETFVVREIPQANNQIRPWDMGTDAGRRIVITTRCSLADHQARIVVTDG